MEPGEVIAGRYEIERLWAAGGMAVVYRAHDSTSGRLVAIKVLRRAATATELERFGREADILATLKHPGIVMSVDRGVTALGESYIVQEWIEGTTLRDRLRTKPLSVQAAVGVAIAVAEALAEAHSHGIVHRDIKPSNIMLVGDDPAVVKVVDFGIARILTGPVRQLTRTGAVVGTVNYMAPEQARGDRLVDARADVFALGAVLYECLAGREAFRGKNVLATRAKIIALHPVPLTVVVPGLAVALSTLVDRFLMKAPDDRPRDGAAVVDALRALGELPEPPARAPELRDALDASDAFTCVVLTAPATPLLGKGREELQAEVDAVSDGFGCTGIVMDDSSALITCGGDGTAAARAVALTRTALMLKRRWDVVPIAVAGGIDGGNSERSIDGKATALDSLTIQSVFAEDGGGSLHGVLIEPDVAALIETGFEFTGDTGSLRVVAERR